MIDLHCHLLAGIDDGPATSEEALALADALARRRHRAGGRRRRTSLRSIPNGAELVRRAGEPVAAGLGRRGTRWRWWRAPSCDLAHLRGPGRLGELGRMTPRPRRPAADRMPVLPGHAAVRGAGGVGCTARGHRVLLAHPERSPLSSCASRSCWPAGGRRRDGVADRLGVQPGASGPRRSATPTWAVDEGMAHNVSSDAHNTGGRGPVLGEALREGRLRLGCGLADPRGAGGPTARGAAAGEPRAASPPAAVGAQEARGAPLARRDRRGDLRQARVPRVAPRGLRRAARSASVVCGERSSSAAAKPARRARSRPPRRRRAPAAGRDDRQPGREVLVDLHREDAARSARCARRGSARRRRRAARRAASS